MPSKNKFPKTRILVFGTFDFIHKGHLNFFRQARRLAENPDLIVSVARDVNVKKIKGLKSFHNEKYRAKKLKKLALIDRVVLGGKTNYIYHIRLLKPDVIALGYDQTAYTKSLRADLRRFGLNTKIIRLKPYRPHVYKSSLILKSML